MPRSKQQRVVTFRVQDDYLEMLVTFKQQPERNYTHRCTRDVFREVAYAIEDHAAGGTTLEQIVDAIDAPYTQVNVALAFMKERGCVEIRHRRTFPASDIVYEDAMIEFMHLADH
tara:strand:+ start:105 stop:449 length:345 start_codon:yes stop_codon:yes gene_type:complete